MFAIVAKAAGRKKEDAQLETHKQYIDIQFILSGNDMMGWKPKSSCTQPSAKYDQETDIQFFKDEPDTWLLCKPGTFAIFSPEDAHMPMVSSDEIHKIIVKVAVDQ